MRQSSSVWRHFDIWLTTAVLLLTAYGILIIRSAITNTPAFVGYEIRQMQFTVLSLVVMLAIAAIDYRIFTAGHWYVYFLLVGLLVLVLAIGAERNNVVGWIPLGPLSFQPAELGRISIPISLGAFLTARQDRIGHFSNTIWSLVYMGIPIGLIFIQPDLGMTIVYVVVWFGIIMIAGLPLRHFFVLITLGVLAIGIAYPNLAPYQRVRITSFVDPDSDPEQSRNVNQAVISVGTGGWWGKGYFQGTQSQLGFLRVQHTDFIFSVLTEEMGFFFGSLVVVGLMGFILLRILRIASITPDPTGQYICVGIATSLFFQVVVSVGMNTRLMPVTGLTFPFVSYGGSSLLTLYMGIGVVQSVLMRHRKQEFG